MLGPVLDLMLDAIDMAATVVVLLALWDGRKAEVRARLIAWLSGRPIRGAGVDRFVAMARASPRLRAARSAPAEPAAADRLPDLPDRPAQTGDLVTTRAPR